MANKSYNEIRGTEDNWALDDRNGLPYSGKSIREFQQKKNRQVDENTARKHGATFFDQSTMKQYKFASEEAKAAWIESGDPSLIIGEDDFNFSSEIEQLKITSVQPTTLWFTTTAQKAEITVGFVSRKKGITDTEWEEVENDVVRFSVRVDADNKNNWVTVQDNIPIASGKTLTVDVRKYLETGENRVQFVGVSEITEKKATLTFAANVTAMFLAPANFDWATPFVEGSSYALGSLNLGGNLEKVLHILVTGNGYSKQYDVARPAQSEPTYYFEGLEFPTTGTGVYRVDMWLTAASVESEHLTYDIMCIAAADVATAQLVVMNETPAEVENYSEADIFKYACYNAGASTATPAVRVEVGNIIIADEQLADVATQTAHTFSAPIEIETEATNLAVEAEITFGNTAQRNIPLNNAASFPATPDAVFYLQPSARSNSQPNREQVVNAVTGETVETTAERIAWVDGIDGWTTDEEGRRCLRIPAGSRLTVARQLLASISSAGKSIEFVYRVRTATEDDPVITICDDPASASFRGLKILPEQIILHSRDLNVSDLSQSYFVETEALLDVVVSIIPQFRNDKNLHVAIIFVNGVKACEFSYSATDSFATAADLIMGSLTSDLDIYAVREYNRAFTSEAALRNQEASLRTREEKAQAKAENTVDLDAYGNMSYKAVKGRVNTFTVKMRDGASLPSYRKDKEYFAYCDLTIDIVQKAWKVVLQWLRIEGQGTTSMNYWLWNLRYRIDKSGNVIIIYPDGTEATIGNVWFDGVGVHPAVERLTFKKNYASSMQSHKMGSCRMFNEVMFYLAEKHPDWELLNEAGALMAVYQYPALGFELTEVENSDELADRWMGLFTIGPDKNDPATFGYDKFKNTLLRFEGLDHNYKAVGFDYPYHRLKYVAETESVCYKKGDAWQKAWEVGAAGTAKTENEVQAYLDEEYAPMYQLVYDCSTMLLGTTATLDEMNANVEAWNKQKDSEGHAYERYEFWRDGEYDVLYLDEEVQQFRANGTNLLTQLGITAEELEGLTLDEKNERFKEARRAIFKAQAANYINVRQNIITMQHGLIIAATDNLKKNTYFDKFTDTADGGRYRQKRDDDDSIFRTDNQGYPSKKYSVEQYDWTDATKTAYVFKGEDSRFFRLLTECFPDECQECGREILAAMAANAVGNDSMSRLIAYINQTFFAPAQKYFSRAAYNADTELAYEEAFPHYVNGDYEVDVNPLAQAHGSSLESERAWAVKRMIYLASKFRFGAFAEYTNASLGRITFRTQQTISLTLTPAMDLYPCVLSGQGGGVYAPRTFKGESVTLAGVGGTNTNVYIMAADYLEDIGDLCQLPVDASTNATLGISSKRLKRLKIGDEVAENVTSNVQTLDITSAPALLSLDARNLASLTDNIDLTSCTRIEEALLGGTNVRSVTLLRGSKIERLQLSDSMTSLSLLSVAYLTPDTLEYNTLANIEYLRLENNAQFNGFALLKEAFNITTTTSVEITPSWTSGYYLSANDDTPIASDEFMYCEYFDVSAYKKLICTMWFGSTTGIVFYDANKTKISLATASSLGVSSLTQVTNVECPVPSYAVYARISTGVSATNEFVGVKEQRSALKNIRVVGFYYEGDATDLDMLATLANGSYTGIDADGRETTGLPVIEGTLRISTPVYEDSLETVNQKCPALDIIADGGYYIRFDDDAVREICATNWGDKTGITKEQAAAVTSIGTVFSGNTKITSFNEIRYFTGITEIENWAFSSCSQLGGDMFLPNITVIGVGAFDSTMLHSIEAPQVTDIYGGYGGDGAFRGCANLVSAKFPQARNLTYSVFAGCANLSELVLGDVVSLNSYTFKGCASLELDVNFPHLTTMGTGTFAFSGITKVSDLGSITRLGNEGFQNCKNLTSVIIPETVTAAGNSAFQNCSSLEYIVSKCETPFSLQNGYVFSNTNNCPIYVPDASVTAYREASVWSGYADRIYPMSIYEEGGLTEQIIFKNSAVEAICLGNFDFNNNGYISKAEAVSVTNVGTLFKDNTEITSFDEFQYFTGVTNLAYTAFMGCTNLVSIKLPPTLTELTELSSFNGCTSLSSINLENLEKIAGNSFIFCAALGGDLILPNIKSTISFGAFARTSIQRVLDLGQCNALSPEHTDDNGAFRGCEHLTLVILPETIANIGWAAFYQCSALEVAIFKGTVPCDITTNIFLQTPIADGTGSIYVPDESVEVYKAATNWNTTYASRIFPISQLQTDNEEMFNEIYEFIKDIL